MATCQRESARCRLALAAQGPVANLCAKFTRGSQPFDLLPQLTFSQELLNDLRRQVDLSIDSEDELRLAQVMELQMQFDSFCSGETVVQVEPFPPDFSLDTQPITDLPQVKDD